MTVWFVFKVQEFELLWNRFGNMCFRVFEGPRFGDGVTDISC